MDDSPIQTNLLVVEGLNDDVTKALVKTEKNEKAAEKARDEALQAKADEARRRLSQVKMPGRFRNNRL